MQFSSNPSRLSGGELPEQYCGGACCGTLPFAIISPFS